MTQITPPSSAAWHGHVDTSQAPQPAALPQRFMPRPQPLDVRTARGPAQPRQPLPTRQPSTSDPMAWMADEAFEIQPDWVDMSIFENASVGPLPLPLPQPSAPAHADALPPEPALPPTRKRDADSMTGDSTDAGNASDAPYDKRRRLARMRPEERLQIVQLATKLPAAPQTEIARKFGTSQSHVSTLLKQYRTGALLPDGRLRKRTQAPALADWQGVEARPWRPGERFVLPYNGGTIELKVVATRGAP